MKNEAKPILARLAILFTTMIWGASFVILKNTLNDLPVYFVLGVRGVLASLFLSVLFFRSLRKINRSYLWQGGVMGVILFVSYAFQTHGLIGTTAGKNAFLTSVYCVLVPFIYWIFTRIRPDRYNLIAAFTCLIGIGFVSLKPESLSGGPLMALGDVLTLVCGFLFAVHIIAIAKFSEGKDVLLLTIIQFYVFAALSWAASLMTETMPSHISGPDILGLLYLGIFASAIGLALQSIGQKYTPASQAAVIMSLEGVFGVIFSILFLHETVTPQSGIGFVLIFAAVVISETKMNIHPIAYFQDVYARMIEKGSSVPNSDPDTSRSRRQQHETVGQPVLAPEEHSSTGSSEGTVCSRPANPKGSDEGGAEDPR